MVEIIARLVFDSWTERTPELRSAAVNDRHLIYEGDGVILDLLVRQMKGGASLQVGGQVLPANDTLPETAVSDLPVVIEYGNRHSYTHTNALGEFAFETAPNGLLDLAIILKNRRFCVRGLSNTQPMMWRVEASLAAGD